MVSTFSKTRSHMLSKIERRVLNVDDEITHFPHLRYERGMNALVAVSWRGPVATPLRLSLSLRQL